MEFWLLVLLIFLWLRHSAKKRRDAEQKKHRPKIPKYTPDKKPRTPTTQDKHDASNKEVIGKMGEEDVHKAILRLPGKGIVLANLYLPLSGSSQETTEIDLLLIHERGVFCVEVKNFTGRVWGDSQYRNWRLYPYHKPKDGAEYYEFYNPILQNATHVSALEDLLEGTSITSVVVFGVNARINIRPNGDTTNCTVCSLKDFHQKMKWLLDSSSTRLSDSDMRCLGRMLMPYTKVSEKVKARHREFVQSRKGKGRG